jgi:hypothetical protein
MSYRPSLIRIAAAVAALVACSCARSPSIAVSSSGHMPADASIALAPDDQSSVTALEILKRMQQRGGEPSQPPDFVLQVATARAPALSGAAVAAGESSQWVRVPKRRAGGRTVARLTLSLTERLTGHEVYRASAESEPARRPPTDEQLIEALLPVRPMAPSPANAPPAGS